MNRKEVSPFLRLINSTSVRAIISVAAAWLRLMDRIAPWATGKSEPAGSGTSRTLQTPLGSIAVRRWGNRDAPCVLLVPGWDGDAAQFEAFVPPLLDAGFQVFAYSKVVRHDPGLVRIAFTLDTLASELGPFAGTIAHSSGAPAVMLAAAVGANFGRAVFISPLARRKEHIGASAAEEVRVENLAARMAMPVLLIHDVDDHEVPSYDSERYAASWPHARLLGTAGLGHWGILRDPHVIAEAVAFLLLPGRS